MKHIPNRSRLRFEKLWHRRKQLVLLAAITVSLNGCENADDRFAETASAQVTSGETERQVAADDGHPESDQATAPAQDGVIDSGHPVPSQPAEQESELGPEIVLSVDDQAETVTYRGWAVSIEASLMHPDLFTSAASEKPINLATREGTWSDGVRIEVTNTGGQSQLWDLIAQPATGTAITLDTETTAELNWWLSPDQTAEIPPGEYAVTLVLDMRGTAVPGTWEGVVRSESAILQIADEPDPLTESLASEKRLAHAAFARSIEKPELAVAEVDQILANDPEHISALTLKAELLQDQGQLEQAMNTYGDAIDVYLHTYGATPPPEALLEKQNELLDQLLLDEAVISGDQ